MNKIKSERIRLGLTQQGLSTLLGIPKRTIEDWEAERRKCPDYVERLILDKLKHLGDKRDEIRVGGSTGERLHREQGQWEKHGNEKTCSLCQFIYYSNNDDFNYCPNCGAKMYK